jgi:hypothetical protein
MILRGLRPNAIIYTSLNSANTGEGRLEEEKKEGKEGKMKRKKTKQNRRKKKTK